MEEPKNDAQDRIKEFLKRYEELTKELNVDFANFPVYMPEQDGSFKTRIQVTPIDMKNLPVKSPFIPDAK